MELSAFIGALIGSAVGVIATLGLTNLLTLIISVLESRKQIDILRRTISTESPKLMESHAVKN